MENGISKRYWREVLVPPDGVRNCDVSLVGKRVQPDTLQSSSKYSSSNVT